MSKNLKWFLIGAMVVILLATGGIIGWISKPVKHCPDAKDTLYVKGDTVLIPYPVEIIKWKEKQPSVYDTTKQEYEAYFDSNFVNNNDTIKIDLAVMFAEKTKEFEIDMDIEHRDYEKLRIDTVKVNWMEIKEVEVDNPLWIWTTVIGGILLILSIVFGG